MRLTNIFTLTQIVPDLLRRLVLTLIIYISRRLMSTD